MKTIKSFSGEYRFLSNFFPCHLMVLGTAYSTVEHAYQASKTQNLYVKQAIAACQTPGKAKAFLKDHNDMQPDAHWTTVYKLETMERLLKLKFDGSQPLLVQALLKTGKAELIEGNSHDDIFWGVCGGVGENYLGRLLMKIRDELRDEKERIEDLLIKNAGSKKLTAKELKIYERQLYEKIVAYEISYKTGK